MLSRQVAPLLRKFCKVSAHFTIARQRSHALAMLRSFKVILSFSNSCPRGPRGLVPKLQHVNSITNFPKALGHASARGLEYFERPVNADERAARYRSKLRRTWATAPDGAQALAFSAWGSSLRAGPVSWPPCARAGWPPPSRGSCARTAFHTPCGASSREKRPRVASSF